jgi:hypothetical protein
MILSVKLTGNAGGSKVIHDMEKKCEALPFPFIDLKVREVPTVQGCIYITHWTFKIMRPMFIAIFPIGAALVFQRIFLLYIAAGILALEFFLTDWFAYVILRLGLRKAGYKGKVKYLSRHKALEAICENV